MIARILRRNRFLATAFPARRLMAYATSVLDEASPSKKLTVNGPDRPRNGVFRSATNVRRDRIVPTVLTWGRTD
jgi:hypothetical protein